MSDARTRALEAAAQRDEPGAAEAERANEPDPLHHPERHYPHATGMLEERLQSLLDALDAADCAPDDYWRERAAETVRSHRALSRAALARVAEGAEILRAARTRSA